MQAGNGTVGVEVRHEPEQSRYALYEDGELIGVADYVRRGDTLIFTHTGIAPDRRGGGLGSTLVDAAMADVREQGGLSVRPACSFVREWFQAHPEQAELLG